MILLAQRYQVRPHHFIPGAWFIVDTKPRHSYSTKQDWTDAPLSIVKAVCAQAETLGDAIAICNDRASRLKFRRMSRANTLRRRRERDFADALWLAQAA